MLLARYPWQPPAPLRPVATRSAHLGRGGSQSRRTDCGTPVLFPRSPSPNGTASRVPRGRV